MNIFIFLAEICNSPTFFLRFLNLYNFNSFCFLSILSFHEDILFVFILHTYLHLFWLCFLYPYLISASSRICMHRSGGNYHPWNWGSECLFQYQFILQILAMFCQSCFVNRVLFFRSGEWKVERSPSSRLLIASRMKNHLKLVKAKYIANIRNPEIPSYTC